MEFYSLNIDINDRRSHTLELFNTHEKHRLMRTKSFVIDIGNNNKFKALFIPIDTIIKSFKLGSGDLFLKSSQVNCYKKAGVYTLEISQILNDNQSDKPITTEIPKNDISFDDLEEYSSGNSKKSNKNKPNEVITQITDSRTDLGTLNDYVNLSFVAKSDYGIFIEAELSQPLNDQIFENCDAQIDIQLLIDGIVYCNSVLITFSHAAQFIGIALDFGSESSQMAVKRYEYNEPYNSQFPYSENLFKNIESYHKNKGWVSKESAYNFYQEEPNTNFYKSLFFLKEKLSGDYTNFDQLPFLKDVNNNLKMLVSKDEKSGDNPTEPSSYTTLTEHKYYQLPNLKILHKYERILEAYNFEIEKDGYPIPLKLRDLKQKVYNTILEVMIVSFLKKEFVRYDNAKRNIRLMLLVPNNYDTKDINKTQLQLNNIFENLSQTDEYKGKILSWEVLTISESDASFIGYIDKNNLQIENNKDFIIVDSGKGTTDFSIIRTGKNNIYDLKPIYRNGFTGAGNLITYAIFETVLHYIREQSNESGKDILFIKNKIINTLTSNELLLRNNFYQQLERLKFNYTDKRHEQQVRANWKSIRSGDITFSKLADSGSDIKTLTELLSQVNSITDFYGYIQDACDFISNNVASYLKIIKNNKEDLDISGVIFTGRAFNFNLLADILSQKLITDLDLKSNQIELLHGKELKDICIRGVFNNSIKLNSEVTGYPIQLIYTSKDKTPDLNKAQNKKTFGKKLFDFFINDLSDLDELEEIKSLTDTIEVNSLQRSHFLIGCKRYALRNDEFLATTSNNNYQVSIDFTQRGYVIRRFKAGKVDLISALEEIDEGGNADKSLIIPSLFPNHIENEFVQAIDNNLDIKKQNDDLYFGSQQKTKNDQNDDKNALFF